jgi:hypothetical protein
MSKINIEANKWKSKFRKDARIKECFHYDSLNCSDKIISAHSIQRNNVLSLIESSFKGNLSVYSFLNVTRSTDGRIVGFEPIGKKEASTFFGFCGYHDNELFKEIENNPIDLGNDLHCFLLSYRAFAKDFHAKKESLKAYKTNLDIIPPGLIFHSELGHRDGLISKNKINGLLESNNYDSLEYLTYELPFVIPLALSASINPFFNYQGEMINDPDNIIIPYEYINFIIQPTNDGRTVILLSCFYEDTKSCKLLDQLSSLNDLKFLRAISSLAISHVENTFFSPIMWTKLNYREKQQLLYELEITDPFYNPERFFHSKINFFDKRFKI